MIIFERFWREISDRDILLATVVRTVVQGKESLTGNITYVKRSSAPEATAIYSRRSQIIKWATKRETDSINAKLPATMFGEQ